VLCTVSYEFAAIRKLMSGYSILVITEYQGALGGRPSRAVAVSYQHPLTAQELLSANDVMSMPSSTPSPATGGQLRQLPPSRSQ
jgi:hypothetical protein